MKYLYRLNPDVILNPHAESPSLMRRDRDLVIRSYFSRGENPFVKGDQSNLTLLMCKSY